MEKPNNEIQKSAWEVINAPLDKSHYVFLNGYRVGKIIEHGINDFTIYPEFNIPYVSYETFEEAKSLLKKIITDWLQKMSEGISD